MVKYVTCSHFMMLNLERFGLANPLAQAYSCDISFQQGRPKPIRTAIRQQVAAVAPVTVRYLATRDDSSVSSEPALGEQQRRAERDGVARWVTVSADLCGADDSPSHDGKSRIFSAVLHVRSGR
jgi:hypothetical protein